MPYDTLQYAPTKDFVSFVIEGLGVAQNSLLAARVGNLDILNNQVIAINRGMNVVGESYLDKIDESYANDKISRQDYTDVYRDYYASVIERESLIEVESRSLNEDNLIMANVLTNYDLARMDLLESNDVPLYSTVEDAVLAFKQEAMPLTLRDNTEYSAILDAVEIYDSETGQNETYYYYPEIKQGTEDNVVGNAILGMRGGADRMLLHTHPVNGGTSRYFSGDPENQGLLDKINGLKYLFDLDPRTSFRGDMGDSNVPTTLGYGGIYVITSAAEVKLYEGRGEANIGSGHNTYAYTKDELHYVSTIDLY